MFAVAAIGSEIPQVLKGWLKQRPLLYLTAQRGYYAGLYVVERFLGTRLQGWLWKRRALEDSGLNSSEQPHRAMIIRLIARQAPVESLLEVGCGTGPNLAVIRRAFPQLRYCGIDLSGRAIAAAQQMVAEQAIRGADLSVGRAEDLRRFADKSIDVVLTDATLMYVGPDMIRRTLLEMTRVARKGLVLNEWNLFAGGAQGSPSRWHYAHWIHDYRRLLADVPGVRNVVIDPLPAGMWADRDWNIFGATIQVELAQD